MANHKSSLKRIRQTATRKARNHYYAKTARNAVRDLRATTEKNTAAGMLPKVSSMLDKLAKRNIIHRNKDSSPSARNECEKPLCLEILAKVSVSTSPAIPASHR